MDPRPDPLGPDDPRQVGAFALLGVLGSGGMGRVYLGQSRGGRRVAVKVVRSALADHPEFRSRFRLEVEAARHMNGIYTAGLVDADPDARQPWMATRYINGRSLHQEVRADGPMPPERVLELALGIAEALEKIHDAGYVHRDLKPSNVVIDQYGPHVIDFGIIAKAADASGLTQTGQVVGTPGYMSPEQLAGGRAESPTDIFSFGAMVYHAATGLGPPAVLHAEPDVSAVTDGRVSDVVRECMARDPKARPTASALVTRLAALLAPSSTLTPSGNTSTRPAAGVSPVPTATPSVVRSPTAGPPVAAATATGVATATGAATATAGSGPGGGRRRRWVAAAAATAVVVLSTAGILAPRLWEGRSGSLSGCSAVAPDGDMSLVKEGSDGQCYGITDSARPGDGPESGFGRDPAARRLQARLFSTNRLNLPVTPEDLTVVWFGALSCPQYRADGVTCADGREYDAERHELQALQLAQTRDDLRGQVHAVVANAGADMRYAKEVAQLIIDRRASLGRVVVIGGGDSRTGTKEAITTLAAAGIPFIAPNLTSDDEGPGQPFAATRGYLQITPPNQTFAAAAVAFVAAHSPPTGRQVLVYHVPDPTDLYTESLARDVQFEARSHPRTAAAPARIIGSLAALPTTVCRSGPAGTTPAALFFADRWHTFGPLVTRITELCGPEGAAMLLGNDSVNRFMTNDAARSGVEAPWPVAYFKNGTQCSEVEALARREPDGEAARLLRAARSVLRQCDPATGSQQMGDAVSLFWDAVAVADRVRPDAGVPSLGDTSLAGATGLITVRNGRVVWSVGTARPLPLCVPTVDRTSTAGRSFAACDTAFAGR